MVAPKKQYVPERGDVIWLTLAESQGHEQTGRRPSLVISPSTYNKRSKLVLAAPITSHVKGYPFEVVSKGKKHDGVVLTDQVRAVDWRLRNATFMERCNSDVLLEVQDRIISLVRE